MGSNVPGSEVRALGTAVAQLPPPRLDRTRYVVRALKFKCVDESGFDWPGSDEPYWVFTAQSGRRTRSARSKVWQGIDSGDRRTFSRKSGKNVIWPARGATGGATGPIGVSIQLWENDQGNPDAIARIVSAAFAAGGFIPGVGPFVTAAPKIVRDQIARTLSDDLMGSRTIFFPTSVLRRHLRRRGAKFQQKLRFGGRNGDLPFTVAGGPDYDLWVEVQRVS